MESSRKKEGSFPLHNPPHFNFEKLFQHGCTHTAMKLGRMNKLAVVNKFVHHGLHRNMYEVLKKIEGLEKT